MDRPSRRPDIRSAEAAESLAEACRVARAAGDSATDRASMNEERPPSPRPRCRRLTGVRVLATGSYVPDAVVTNEHLHSGFGFDSDWIVKRTGILERRHALPHQATSDLCYEAARRCIERRRQASDIDLLLLGHLHAGHVVPLDRVPGAGSAQAQLPGRRSAGGLCRLHVRPHHRGGLSSPGASDMALIIGGDCNSRVVNPDDIKTYPLFGDGAGAVLLTRGRPDQGILSYSLGADGSGGDLLSRPACGSRTAADAGTARKGPALHAHGRPGRLPLGRRHPVRHHPGRARSQPDAGEVDLYIPHQANIRIINAAIDVLHIPRSKVFNNLDRYGNTSAGSIPLVLDEGDARRPHQADDLVVLSGFGAGLAWGTALMRW